MQSAKSEEIGKRTAAGAAGAPTGPEPDIEGDARPHPEPAAPLSGRRAPTREA
jgi:hypothetical protein